MSNKNYVSATVALYSKSGKSMFKENISLSNIGDFKPTQDTIDGAVEELTKLGVNIKRVSKTGTISVQASKKTFEKIFKITLEDKVQNGSKYYEAKGEIKMPDTLTPYVERVVLPVPPMYF